MCVCSCVWVCVYMLDFLIFEPLQFINDLRYRVQIWYSSEAVMPLESWQYLCKFKPNLKFYGILDFLKNVYGSSNFRKIWAIVQKMHRNIIHRSRTYDIEFDQNRLKRRNCLKLLIFWNLFLNCVICASSELLSSKFVYECCFLRVSVRIGRGL